MNQDIEITPQPPQARAVNPRLALLVAGAVVLAAVGLAIALVFAFSRGGGETTPDSELVAYLNDTAALLNDIDDRTGDAEVASPGEAFIVYAAVLQETSGQMSAVEPPAEVEEAHNEMVEALSDGGSRMLDLSDLHPNVRSLDEVDQVIIEDEEVTAASGRLVAACREISKLAVEREIEVAFEIC